MPFSRSRNGAVTVALGVGLFLGTSATAHAREIPVSPGEDFVDVMRSASAGDVLLLSAGTYDGGRWIDVQGREGAPITVRGAGAIGEVVIEGGSETLRIGGGASWLIFENLELRNSSDNLIHIDDSSHILLREIRAHDAGLNGDVIKINQASFIELYRVETWGAGRRDGGEIPFQECIDFVDVDDVIVSESYLHDCGDILMYAKGGSRRVVFERNVFDCGDTELSQPAVGLGAATAGDLIDGDFEGYEMVARNNLFLRCSNGGLGIYDVQGAWVVHNLFFDVRGPIMQIRAGNGPAGRSEDVHVVNNVIVSMPGTLSDVFTTQDREVSGFESRSNLYWNAGNPIPTGGLSDPNGELGVVIGDPGVSACAGTSFDDWIARCAPTAMTAIDHGTSLAGTPGEVLNDIRGFARPLGGAPDPGPYEGPGDPPPPAPPPPVGPPGPPPPPGTDAAVSPTPPPPPGRDGGAGDAGSGSTMEGGCSAAGDATRRGAHASTLVLLGLALATTMLRRSRRGR